MPYSVSMKLFLCNVSFCHNISVFKVYSKSFFYNVFNDFAGYSPHPSFICFVKSDYGSWFCKKGHKDSRTLPNITSMTTSQEKRLEK